MRRDDYLKALPQSDFLNNLGQLPNRCRVKAKFNFLDNDKCPVRGSLKSVKQVDEQVFAGAHVET